MVKVNAPALSLDASGSLAGSMVFSKWKGRNYVRSLVRPANPQSGGQVGVRSMFRFLTQQWDALAAGDQATWEDRAEDASISPFNAFVAYNQFRWRNFLAPTQSYPEAETAFSGTLGGATAAAGVRSITVTQPVTAAGNGWGIAFFRADSTGFSTAFDNLKRIVEFDGTNDIVFVDSPLDPGTYYYNLRSITDDGALGAELGEVSDTVT
jgi:hypothetical protein